MNLYLVLDEGIEMGVYDIFCSAVVSAPSEESAREIRHGHPVFNPETKICWESDNEELTVTLIGTCLDEQTGVITAEWYCYPG